MDWFKKHTDTLAIISAILGSFLWMNSQINELRKDIHEIEKDVSTIKVVLFMKNILLGELAKKDE